MTAAGWFMIVLGVLASLGVLGLWLAALAVALRASGRPGAGMLAWAFGLMFTLRLLEAPVERALLFRSQAPVRGLQLAALAGPGIELGRVLALTLLVLGLAALVRSPAARD